jgi:hypothetical protein
MLNKLLKPFYCIIILLLFIHRALAQTAALPDDKTKPDDKSKQATSKIKFGLNYVSNNVFMGRTDSIVTPTIIPEVKYTLKSGIYFSGSLYYTPNKKTNKLDGGELTAGYDADLTDELSASASYSKSFYSANSTEITSSIKDAFSVDFDYDFGAWLSPSLSFDYILNKKGSSNQFFTSLAIDHDFIKKGVFGSNDLLFISPTFTLNTGDEGDGNFKVMDYELSTPIFYKTGHFICQFAPTYSIPENIPPDFTTIKPANKNSVFYFETGVALKF